MNLEIRELTKKDWPAVAAIYLDGIATGNATFETDIPTWGIWDSRHHKFCRFVATSEDVVTGWAALSPVSKRRAYAGVAEVSIYISENARGKGVGTSLLGHLINESRKHGIWTLQAVIFPENEASLRLHEKLGFRKVGYRERISIINNTWRNTLLMEKRF